MQVELDFQSKIIGFAGCCWTIESRFVPKRLARLAVFCDWFKVVRVNG